jgi:desulfoferrodoxin (superoxide reductase-like protein)
MRRRYKYRWQRVEFEARQIERGKWKEPKHTPFIPVDDRGKRIEKIDVQVPEVPASCCVGSSLADRVRVLTPEEWARL